MGVGLVEFWGGGGGLWREQLQLNAREPMDKESKGED